MNHHKQFKHFVISRSSDNLNLHRNIPLIQRYKNLNPNFKLVKGKTLFSELIFYLILKTYRHRTKHVNTLESRNNGKTTRPNQNKIEGMLNLHSLPNRSTFLDYLIR